MKRQIHNIEDLKLEIARLSQLKNEQEHYLTDQFHLLKRKIEAPARIMGAITSSIPGVDLIKGLFSTVGSVEKPESANKRDWLTRTMQLALPMVLNRTFLKKSGWLKKAVVLLASETAAGQVTQDKVGAVISKIADFVRPKRNKKKHKSVPPLEENDDTLNFGIPPDSETY